MQRRFFEEIEFAEVEVERREQAPRDPALSFAGVLADRSARLPRFVGLEEGTNADLLLDRLKVALVGAGSVGARIALHCARLLIAALWIVDHGFFKRESLLTQPVFPPAIGLPKASHVGRLCKEISPHSLIRAFDGSFQDLDMAALADVDLVLLASDNLAAEAAVGERCLQLGKPLLQASVHGETLVAQLRSFTSQDPTGPCPTCGFGPAELSQLNHEVTFSCAGPAAGASIARPAAPTMSVSFLCSLAADLAMTQLLRHALSLGQPLGNTLVEHCGYTWKSLVAPLSRNPSCPCEHLRWTCVSAPPTADLSTRQLFAAAGLASSGAALPRASLTVDHHSFSVSGACGCGKTHSTQRFVEAGQDIAAMCDACGEHISVQPFFLLREVPASALASVGDRPLRELGVHASPSVLVRTDGNAVLLPGSFEK